MYGISSDFQKRDVAIYARVSTEHEAQLSALENQMDWYKPILAARPEWTLVKQYVDEGITGTSAEKRPHFMEMIKDAKAHKFNMIITREVSRFARNTVDTLQYTRMLKDYGVEVFFIKENYKRHFPVFDTVIPATIRLGEISTKDKSIFKHDPNGKAAKAYANLVKEVQGIGEKQRIQPSDLSR